MELKKTVLLVAISFLIATLAGTAVAVKTGGSGQSRKVETVVSSTQELNEYEMESNEVALSYKVRSEDSKANFVAYRNGYLKLKVYGQEGNYEKKGKVDQDVIEQKLSRLESVGFFELNASEVPVSNESEEFPLNLAYASFNGTENRIKWRGSAELNSLEALEEIVGDLTSEMEITNSYVELGEKFNLETGESAKVRGTDLDLEVTAIEDKNIGLSLSYQTGVKGQALLVNLSEGETQEFAGFEISFHRIVTGGCDVPEESNRTVNLTRCAKEFAVLEVNKAESEPEVEATVGEAFEVDEGQEAVVYKQVKIAPRPEAMRLELQSLIKIEECYREEPGDVGDDEEVPREKPVDDEEEPGRCRVRSLAKLSVQTEEEGYSSLTIAKGESETIGNYRLRLHYTSGNTAKFSVSRVESPISKEVKLGEPFALKPRESAYQPKTGVYMSFIDVSEICPLKDKEGGSGGSAEECKTVGYLSVSKKPQEIEPKPKPAEDQAEEEYSKSVKGGSGGQTSEYKKRETEEGEIGRKTRYIHKYRITEESSVEVYGVEIKAQHLSKERGRFVIEKDTNDMINVNIDEDFELEEDQSARVIDANLQLNVLSVANNVEKPVQRPDDSEEPEELKEEIRRRMVKFSVNKFIQERLIGKKLSRETARNMVVKKKAVSESGGGSAVDVDKPGSEGGSSVEIVEPITPTPPKPVETHTLTVGESVKVGDYKIEVKNIDWNSAVFSVTEEGLGITYQLNLDQGWNLISNPGKVESIGTNDCDTSKFRLYEYIEDKNRFKVAQSMQSGEAYWLKNSGEQCIVKFELNDRYSLSSLDTLSQGWNYIPVLPAMKDKTLAGMGDCELKSAYIFNSENNKWKDMLQTRIGMNHYGKGLAVFAREKCSLIGSDKPPMPE